MIVVGAGVVNRDPHQRAINTLERVDANILGLVLNRLPIKGPDAYSYSYESYRPELPPEGRGNRTGSRTTRRRARSSSRSRGAACPRSTG